MNDFISGLTLGFEKTFRGVSAFALLRSNILVCQSIRIYVCLNCCFFSKVVCLKPTVFPIGKMNLSCVSLLLLTLYDENNIFKA